jgi:hypothetical protein
MVSTLAGFLNQASGNSHITLQSNLHPGAGSPVFHGTPLEVMISGNQFFQQFAASNISLGPEFTGLPYSLEQILTLRLEAGASLWFFAGKTEVIAPEPASLAAGLSGLVCLGAYRFRRYVRRTTSRESDTPLKA